MSFEFKNWKLICEEKDKEIAELKEANRILNETITHLLEGVRKDCDTLIANNTHKKS